jgi:hypothetical protein
VIDFGRKNEKKVPRHANQNIVKIAVLGSHSYFGEMEIVQNCKRIYDCRVTSSTAMIYVLKREVLKKTKSIHFIYI